MDKIILKHKEQGTFLTVLDDCIMGMTSWYIPVFSISEDQLGIMGFTVIPFEVLADLYYWPADKKYDVPAFFEEAKPELFGAIEWYGLPVDDDKEKAIEEAIQRMDEESGLHL